jgi:peptidoglycan hydrolase CwlO-like protein
MTDTDKILQAIEGLQVGQKALQTTIEQQGKQLTSLQTDVTTLKTDVKGLNERMDTLYPSA